MARGKFEDAGKALEKAVEAFDKKTNLEKAEQLLLAELLEYLGAVRFRQERNDGAEKIYRRALDLREQINGAHSAETLRVVWSLGNLKRSGGDFKSAAALYRRVYDSRLQKLGANDIETNDAYLRLQCALVKNGDKAEAENLKNAYQTAQNNEKKNTAGGQIIEGGVINGRALNLVKPPYTAEAKSQRFNGQIIVNIVIGEDGKVLHACAVNEKAPPSLLTGVENAALLSTFQPTKIGGTPVKVQGVLVYNFSF